MTKLAPEWVRTSDPVIRSPARYRWTLNSLITVHEKYKEPITVHKNTPFWPSMFRINRQLCMYFARGPEYTTFSKLYTPLKKCMCDAPFKISTPNYCESGAISPLHGTARKSCMQLIALYTYECRHTVIISPKYEISGILWFCSGARLRCSRRTPRLVFHITATPMRVSNSYLTQPLMT